MINFIRLSLLFLLLFVLVLLSGCQTKKRIVSNTDTHTETDQVVSIDTSKQVFTVIENSIDTSKVGTVEIEVTITDYNPVVNQVTGETTSIPIQTKTKKKTYKKEQSGKSQKTAINQTNQSGTTESSIETTTDEKTKQKTIVKTKFPAKYFIYIIGIVGLIALIVYRKYIPAVFGVLKRILKL